MNTNKILGELFARKFDILTPENNKFSSHVKVTGYLRTSKDHRCYGNMIKGAFGSESGMVWYFIGDTEILFSY